MVNELRRKNPRLLRQSIQEGPLRKQSPERRLARLHFVKQVMLRDGTRRLEFAAHALWEGAGRGISREQNRQHAIAPGRCESSDMPMQTIIRVQPDCCTGRRFHTQARTIEEATDHMDGTACVSRASERSSTSDKITWSRPASLCLPSLEAVLKCCSESPPDHPGEKKRRSHPPPVVPEPRSSSAHVKNARRWHPSGRRMNPKSWGQLDQHVRDSHVVRDLPACRCRTRPPRRRQPWDVAICLPCPGCGKHYSFIPRSSKSSPLLSHLTSAHSGCRGKLKSGA